MRRMVPVVRTFISLPVEFLRMQFKRFVTYTFVGSLLWCFQLAWIGYILGKNYEQAGDWFNRIDISQ